MTYVLPIYVAIAWWYPNVHQVFYSSYGFEVALVDIVYPAAFILVIVEFLKVSHPGVENSSEVNRMIVITFAYFGLFLVGCVAGSLYDGFKIFRRTEFLVLLIAAGVQVLMASKLNSRTATRAISNTIGN